MRKLCNGKGRRIHPTPPAPASAQAMLPAAVMALAAALTAEEQEVLSYLLSCGGAGGGGGYRGRRRHAAHVPELGCACFTCYKSFWARWDASPNRHVIHQIIDAVEEGIQEKERLLEVRGGRRRRRRRSRSSAAEVEVEAEEEGKGVSVMDGGHVADDDDDDGDGGGGGDDYDDDCCIDEDWDKSTVRKFVSFIGERVWGVWK